MEFQKTNLHKKKILLLFGCLGFLVQLNAQDAVCQPDSAFLASDDIVSPAPYDSTNMTGGLDAFPACIGEPYELVFSFRLGDSASLNGLGIDLIRAEIATTGAVAGLPEGLNYFCDPPDCVFPDTTAGCIILKGTPTANNTAGVYPLVISAKVVAGLLGELSADIPGPFVPGTYNLVLNNTGECSTTTSVNDYLSQNLTLSNTPNPALDQTLIEVTSLISGDFQFQVFDLAGKGLHNEKIRLNSGYNTFRYDVSKLEAGMYIYTLSDGKAAISQKLIVSK
jgi:hypothetical protein